LRVAHQVQTSVRESLSSVVHAASLAGVSR
jgi:hypothetical protein